MSDYINILRSSDLTLSPVGQNAECYRIYEAMSCGSVPVIEDQPAANSCGVTTSDRSRRTLLTLLRRHEAPVIFVSDWNQLPRLLDNERRLTQRHIVERRKKLVQWHRKFRRKMADIFVQVVQEKFFDGSSDVRKTTAP